MAVFVISFVVILLAGLGMAVGVLAGRAAPRGGCGEPDGAGGCDVCTPRRRGEAS